MWKTHSRRERKDREKSLFLISVSNDGKMVNRTDSWTSITWRLRPRGAREDEYKMTNCLLPPGRIVGLNRDPVGLMSSHFQEELRVELLLVYTRKNQLRSLEHLGRVLPGDLPGEVCPGGVLSSLTDLTSHACRDYISHLSENMRGTQTDCNRDPSDPHTRDTNQDKTKAETKLLVTIFNSRV